MQRSPERNRGARTAKRYSRFRRRFQHRRWSRLSRLRPSRNRRWEQGTLWSSRKRWCRAFRKWRTLTSSSRLKPSARTGTPVLDDEPVSLAPASCRLPERPRRSARREQVDSEVGVTVAGAYVALGILGFIILAIWHAAGEPGADRVGRVFGSVTLDIVRARAPDGDVGQYLAACDRLSGQGRAGPPLFARSML